MAEVVTTGLEASVDELREAAFKRFTHELVSRPRADKGVAILRDTLQRGRLFVVEHGLPFTGLELKKYFNEGSIAHPFRQYTICRDLAGLRLLLTVVTPGLTKSMFTLHIFTKADHGGVHLGMCCRANGTPDFTQVDAALSESLDPPANYREAAANMLSYVFMFLGGLSDKTCSQVVVDASPKEKRMRRLRGKPKVGSYTRVTYATPVSDGVTTSKDYGGTHASPTPHDRRGHYFTRSGRRIWRRATRVNAKKEQAGMPVTSTRTHYEVRA